jgi:hypothetical protein
MRARGTGGEAVRRWTGRTNRWGPWGIWCLVGLLLVAMAMPRFGIVWHDHEDTGGEILALQLLQWLAVSQTPPPSPPHPHTGDAAHGVLCAATSHPHGHYVSHAELALRCQPLSFSMHLLRLSRPRQVFQVIWARRLPLLLGRAPPSVL